MDKDDVKEFATGAAVMAALGVLHTLRFSLFIVLLMLSRLVEPVLSFCSGLALLCFVGLALMGRFDFPAWALLGFAFGAMVVLWGYNALLTALAPDGWIMVHEI